MNLSNVALHKSNRNGLLTELWARQRAYRHIRDEDVRDLADQLHVSEVDIEGVVSFYHFLSREPRGKYTIYLNNSILSEFAGFSKIREAFERHTEARMGTVDPTGTFGLFNTSCMGMSDQEPAALINFRPFTNLTPQKVHRIIQSLKAGRSVEELFTPPHTEIQFRADVENAVFFRAYELGAGIDHLTVQKSDELLEILKKAEVRGMGGAFFPVWLKWEGCRNQSEPVKYVVCNADEGEPGTFKDRILLQRMPGLMIEGMIIGAYIVKAKNGYIYLRAEYEYMLGGLEKTLQDFRDRGWLGNDILGIQGFDFDIDIQLGAGAYVCGEETALLQSLEGKRGEPRAKIHFPTEKGLNDKPTMVNNVETFCAVARCIELGPDQLLSKGTEKSKGHKLLSVAGDCKKPGIYEIEWGMSLEELLTLCEAENTYAVQISGPSGELVSAKERDRIFCTADLSCGGSVMIFNKERDIMQILDNYNHFFMEESCGICTPCRGGNFILRKQLDRINQKIADKTDLDNLHQWSKIMQYASRCGLGKTAPRSIEQAITKFPEYFDPIIHQNRKDFNRDFNLQSAVRPYEDVINRKS